MHLCTHIYMNACMHTHTCMHTYMHAYNKTPFCVKFELHRADLLLPMESRKHLAGDVFDTFASQATRGPCYDITEMHTAGHKMAALIFSIFFCYFSTVDF